jgi:4'-phosphopantetheinyl transferase
MNIPPTTPTVLPPGEVNVWLLRLEATPAKFEQLRALLSPDEASRAARFLRNADRERFTISRGRMRQVLAQYLAADPRDIQFAYENQGKPFLKKTAAHAPLHFNLSHSHQLGLLAVSSTSPVGIDIEHAKDTLDAPGLAKRFFSDAESAIIAGAPDADALRRRFYTCWTRKEAFVKALGSGIAGGLDCFDVLTPESPDAPAAVFAHRIDPSHTVRWALRDLALPEGYFGALCAHAPLLNVSLLHLPGQSSSRGL